MKMKLRILLLLLVSGLLCRAAPAQDASLGQRPAGGGGAAFSGGSITTPVLGATGCASPPYSFTPDPTAGLCWNSTFVNLKSGDASGSNVAGKHTVIDGGLGTGTAAGGSIFVRIAPGGSASGSSQNAVQDAFILRPNTGVIELGGWDSFVAPGVSSFAAVDRVAGVSNGAGGGLDVHVGKGTGTGNGGDMRFFVYPPASGSGSSQNASTQVMKFTSSGAQFDLGGGTAVTPGASTIKGAKSNVSGTAGASLTVQGGDGGVGNADGGDLVLSGGALSGTGLLGAISFSSSWVKNFQGEVGLNADYANATASFTSTALSVTVVSGQTYRVQAVIFASDSTAADGAKLDFNGGSATATNFRMHCILQDTTVTIVNSAQVTALATAFSAATLTGVSEWVCNGTFVPSSNGTFIVRGSQNAHTTGTLTFSRGSWLSVVNMRPL